MLSMEMPVRAQVILVVLLACIIYSNTLDNAFVWDDVHIIVRNPATHRLRHIPHLFVSDFFGKGVSQGTAADRVYWRPLTALSFNLDYTLWGNAPAGYHVTNLLLHSLNAVLVLLLLRSIPRAGIAAFPAALIFVCHPLQTNAVAYISGRTDLLAALFLLLACLVLARGLARPGGTHGAGYAATVCAVGACAALAAMSKESAFAAPLAILLIGALLGKPGASLTLLSVLSSAAAIAGVLCFRHIVDIPSPAVEAASIPVLLAAAKSALVYGRLVLFPLGLHMERFLPVPRPWDCGALFSAGLVLFAALLTARAVFRRDGSPAPLLACWGFAAFLPASNIVPIYPSFAGREIFIGEQFLYLPLAGISAVIALAWIALRDRWRVRGGTVLRAAPMAGGIAVLVLFSVLARIHTGYWRDERTFYSRTLDRAPRSLRANVNLACSYVFDGDYDTALRILLNVVAQNPQAVIVRLNLGHTYILMERYDDARREFQAAQRFAPDDPDVLNGLGVLLMAQGNYADAVPILKSAASVSPHDVVSRVNLASAYLGLNRAVEAVRILRETRDLDPDALSVRMMLGAAYEKTGRAGDALEIYREVARDYPEYTPAVEKADRLMRK